MFPWHCRWSLSEGEASTFKSRYNICIYIYSVRMYIYIYLEPKWPLFLKINPTKQGLFQPKQGSFEFQVYNRYIYIHMHNLRYAFCLPPICPLLLGFNPPTSAGWCPPTVNLLERKCCSPTKKGKSYQTKQVFRALLVRLHQLASYSLPPVHNKVNPTLTPIRKCQGSTAQ